MACSATGPVALIFEQSMPGHRGYHFPALDVPPADPRSAIPAPLLRRTPPRLPEVTEPEVARHYTALSLFNHHVERALYPLGSCTMKYNPKVNEELARTPALAWLHPDAPVGLVLDVPCLVEALDHPRHRRR